MKIHTLCFLLLCLLCTAFATVSHAQGEMSSAETALLEATKEQYKLDNEIRQKEWDVIQEQWAKSLSEVEQFIYNGSHLNQDQISGTLQQLDKLLSKAKDYITKTKSSLRTNKLLLKGIGPDVIGDKKNTSLSITRNQLKSIQLFYENQLNKLEALVSNAGNLKIAVSQLRRKEDAEIIKTRFVIPFLPSTIATVLKNISSLSAGVTVSLTQWLTEHKKHIHTDIIWSTLVFLLICSVSAYYLNMMILGQFGRDNEIVLPSYSRKLTAAVAHSTSTALIAATLIIVIYFLSNYIHPVSFDAYYKAMNPLLEDLLIACVAISLCLSILSPKHPKWRLTKLNPDTSSKLAKVLIYLLIVDFLSSYIMFHIIGHDSQVISKYGEEQNVNISLLSTLFTILRAFGLLYLIKSSVWASQKSPQTQESNALDSITMLCRSIIFILVIVSIVASLSGYAFLGEHISVSIYYTIIFVGIAYIVRQAIQHLAAYVVKLNFIRRYFRLRIITLQRIKLWTSLIVDPFVFCTTLIIILPFWGVPVEKIALWFITAFEGFSIGELTISLKGIMLSIFVFFALMKLTRFIQKFAKQNIFPKSSQNIASQHNTLIIINYLGTLIAIGASIAALGINLQTIAVIMGALSVGIGFGLRNVVSNFVSGVLLLIEKPIKVGDWIQIGEHEGFVKNLKFRSTEIETFQQASVIIPNADLISQPVTNMTLDDQKGRIEVALSVSRSTDPILIHNLLLDVAQGHPGVLKDIEPVVMFMNFGESSLDFELRCFTNDVTRKALIASDLRYQIERVLRDNKIEIPYPQRVIHIADFNHKCAALKKWAR